MISWTWSGGEGRAWPRDLAMWFAMCALDAPASGAGFDVGAGSTASPGTSWRCLAPRCDATCWAPGLVHSLAACTDRCSCTHPGAGIAVEDDTLLSPAVVSAESQFPPTFSSEASPSICASLAPRRQPALHFHAAIRRPVFPVSFSPPTTYSCASCC